MTASRLFSDRYATARVRFIDAAQARRADLTAHRNPHPGPDGEDLFLDCAVLGRHDAPHVLIVQSAAHGVEGFCGSACQLGLLQSERTSTLPDDLKIVVIHALNPFGFAWLRRVNEDNIDLNRNFIDHDAPKPENAAYETLRHAIAPLRLDTDALAAADAVLAKYARENGVAALQSAITKGQYHHPEGLYFGGAKPAWSNALFRKLITEECGHAERVIMIDIHTGLGPYGHGELIIEVGPDDPAYDRAKAWWGASVKSTVSGESVSSHLTGTIDGAVVDLLARQETTAVALEFGTFSPAEVFKATRADNWLHVHGSPDNPQSAAIKSEIRRVFYPDTADWKAMVWERSEEVFAQAFKALTT